MINADEDEDVGARSAGDVSTRLVGLDTGALAPVALGLGVGVVGSLLVGKLLEEKKNKKCFPVRGRRDTTTSTR